MCDLRNSHAEEAVAVSASRRSHADPEVGVCLNVPQTFGGGWSVQEKVTHSRGRKPITAAKQCQPDVCKSKAGYEAKSRCLLHMPSTVASLVVLGA